MQQKNQKYKSIVDAPFHTGDLLKNYFAKHRTRKAALARLMNRTPKTIQGFQKNSSMQVAVLWEFSIALRHNFFLDIAGKLPIDFSTNAPTDFHLQEQITLLETKLKQTEAERDILLKAIQ